MEGLDVSYLDMCHSKASKFRGLHAVLAGFDKNKKVTIVGWAVVPAGTYEYSMQVFAKWYSYKDESGKPLLASWLNDPTHFQMSDRQKGIEGVQRAVIAEHIFIARFI